jgi:hypothetical protein
MVAAMALPSMMVAEWEEGASAGEGFFFFERTRRGEEDEEEVGRRKKIDRPRSVQQEIRSLLSLFANALPFLDQQTNSPADMAIREPPRIGELKVERVCCFF